MTLAEPEYPEYAEHPEYARHGEPLPGRQVALVDLLDRLLSGGVVVTGDIVLSIADIDLVRISLRALIVSVSSVSSDSSEDSPVTTAPDGDGPGGSGGRGARS